MLAMWVWVTLLQGMTQFPPWYRIQVTERRERWLSLVSRWDVVRADVAARSPYSQPLKGSYVANLAWAPGQDTARYKDQIPEPKTPRPLRQGLGLYMTAMALRKDANCIRGIVSPWGGNSKGVGQARNRRTSK